MSRAETVQIITHLSQPMFDGNPERNLFPAALAAVISTQETKDAERGGDGRAEAAYPR